MLQIKIYKHIKLEEREKIYQLLKADISLAKIAKELGRSKTERLRGRALSSWGIFA